MSGVTRTARVEALDILRGIALLGMILVHFNDRATDATSRLAGAYQQAVILFFDERFWAMFGILFGAGFAVQLRRAEARGGAFAPVYLRRLLALAGFGVIAHAVFGYNVLLGYAVWGVPLLLVRRWSTRALVIALVVSAASGSIYTMARASVRVAAVGEANYRAEREALATANRTFSETNRAAQDAEDYSTVFRARLRHMAWFYRQPYSFLPMNTLTLFLIGVIALRLGLFDRPEAHRRLLLAIAAFGVASWAADHWLLRGSPPDPSRPLLLDLGWMQITRGFGLIREMWLALAYIAGVLLLVAQNRVWLRRLRAFGWSGRMALTNYMLQIALLDLVFSRYLGHLQLSPLQALAGGLMLFAAGAVLSGWWLARYHFGPLEWLWRSITYNHRQPWRQREVRTV